MKNIDKKVADDFGTEWEKYDQSALDESQLKTAWNQYFKIFPFDKLALNAEGFDMGCGSGRWAKFVAPLVGKLNCIDPSARALNVAKKNLNEFENISFINASVSDEMLPSESQDFGYCLGVLHHIPDTKMELSHVQKHLKKGLLSFYTFTIILKTDHLSLNLFGKLQTLLEKLFHHYLLNLRFLFAI